MNRQLDIGFIKRVYRTSVGVWLLSLLLCWGMRNLTAAAGITVGFVISVGSLMILERLVTTLFTADTSEKDRKPVRRLMVVAFLKYAAIAVILWASLRFGLSGTSGLAGIAIGIGIPYAVISLKALGIMLTPKQNADS